jgi:hypothetical protein
MVNAMLAAKRGAPAPAAAPGKQNSMVSAMVRAAKSTR